MIKNRLAVLLAERGLKITKVSHDTGISRNSITSLVQNDSEMIRLETINNLCNYLGVTPNDFFEYIPLDIEFFIYPNSVSYRIEHSHLDPDETEEALRIDKIDVDIIAQIKTPFSKKSYSLICSLANSMMFPLALTNQAIKGIEVFIEVKNLSEHSEYVQNTQIINSSTFKQHIYDELKQKLSTELRNWIVNDLEKFNVTDSLQEQIVAAIYEYVFVRTIHSSIIKPF
ncbi:MAG: helix-turn-helix transcriptional regulator [Solibacillus sp.]